MSGWGTGWRMSAESGIGSGAGNTVLELIRIVLYTTQGSDTPLYPNW